MSNNPLAEIKLRGRSDKPTLEATIAAQVAEILGASGGDTLVVERGTTWAAEKAAARGRYFIVSVKSAPSEQAEQPEEETVEPPQPPPPAFTETLDETIRRLRSERP
jgi:hypothetical protein